jgi:hypothetical protein
VVVLVGHREVEDIIKRQKEEIDVVAIGQFLIGSRCRRELMSLYIDEQGVSCRDIRAAGCD